MENSHESANYGNGLVADDCHNNTRQYYSSNNYQQSSSSKVSLSWLGLKVFYVRVTRCELHDDSTPECLTLNHIPLNHDTLLQVNGLRTSNYSDIGVSSLLRRDRMDKKSEEVTFVCTDSIRMTGSVKFEVFDQDVLLLSGVLELRAFNATCIVGESENHGYRWIMNCEPDTVACTGFLKGKQNLGLDSASPRVEVCVAGCFAGAPIILTKTVQLGLRKKQGRQGMLDSIPEYDAAENQKDVPPGLHPPQASDYPNHDKPEDEEEYSNFFTGTEYSLEGEEDGELSWFNAGVRVGVGIGLSVCVGIGIGVGLLVRTYQGTFRRQPIHI